MNQLLLSVTLVIPVRNEIESIAALIDSITKQSRQPNEIILVDGGSTDDTVALTRRLTQHDERFRIFEAGDATPGRGRNIGAENAQFEWIAFTDAGIRLEPNWLEELIKIAQQNIAFDVVYGSYEPERNTFFERCAALVYVAPKTEKSGLWWRGPSIVSALMRRTIWQKVGGFPDLRSAEDLIFMEKIDKQNFKIGFAPKAIVWWQLRPTLLTTFQKFILYSKHNVWAGQTRSWHYGVLRQYLVVLPFVGLGVAHNLWWFSVPLLWITVRTFKSIWTRRENRGLAWLLNPLQFFYVMPIILTIDAATYIGWAQALLVSPPQRARAPSSKTSRIP